MERSTFKTFGTKWPVRVLGSLLLSRFMSARIRLVPPIWNYFIQLILLKSMGQKWSQIDGGTLGINLFIQHQGCAVCCLLPCSTSSTLEAWWSAGRRCYTITINHQTCLRNSWQKDQESEVDCSFHFWRVWKILESTDPYIPQESWKRCQFDRICALYKQTFIIPELK